MDALLVAARAIVGIVARSLDEVDAELAPPQLRALMIVATRGAMNLAELSTWMGVHPSNATRAVDGLVRGGLAERTESAADRRHTILSLTSRGRALIDRIIAARREAFGAVLAEMDPADRRRLGPALASFATAADEPEGPDRPGWEWPA